MIDATQRSERAKSYFRQGFSCCQSVVLSFSDVTGMTAADAARAASGLGGGVGRLREVCGCVSGMAMVAGYLCSDPIADPAKNRKETYAIVQEMAASFKAEHGSIVCRDILGSRLAEKQNQGAVPAERTPDYYASRPCERLIAHAAMILAEKINTINNNQ